MQEGYTESSSDFEDDDTMLDTTIDTRINSSDSIDAVDSQVDTQDDSSDTFCKAASLKGYSDYRRQIEELLEQKRLRQEMSDYDFGCY